MNQARPTFEIQKSKSISMERFHRFHQKMEKPFKNLEVPIYITTMNHYNQKEPLKSYTIQAKTPFLTFLLVQVVMAFL
jgi:hypothetical protein